MKSYEDIPGGCPQCGASLPAEAPRGLCPACLLKRGLESNTEGPGPHAPFTPPSVDEISPRFPDLEILELLGHGGMGAVYKARQKDLDRTVAVKILPPAVSDDPAFADRFAREAKALARLNHPNIVTIHSSGQTEGLFYFVMEYVDGVHLRKLMQGGRIAPREALAIVPQICDALQYAHDKGIVHRDIKPENILMDRRGNVKVADFGVAKLVETSESAITGPELPELSATEPGRVMGTPQYMAPEQRERPGDVDNRADVYALGVVFYQMLTGELPEKLPVPPSKKVAIDVRLDEVVLRALEREPARRYGQVSEVKTRVQQISSTSPERTAPLATDTPAVPAGPSRFSHTAVWGAVWAGSFLFLPMMFAAAAAIGGIGVAELFVVLFLFPPGLVALTAPLGSTVLGWIAVTKIRNAPDHLHGLGLAVFDALTFPLLALNGTIVFGALLLARIFTPHRLGPVGGMLLVLGIVFGCALVTILLARRVWRWASQDGNIPAGAGTMDREAGRQGAGDERGARAVWVPVAVTVAWHIPLLLGVTAFFVYLVPVYVRYFDDLGMQLPRATVQAIRFAGMVRHMGPFALPLLVILDLGICRILQTTGRRWPCRLWSALFVLVCVVLVLASAATLYLPFTAGPQRQADVPSSAHNATAGHAVMVHHFDGRLDYAIYYPGSFDTSGGTQHNTRSLLWYEDFSIRLEKGATFGCTRESVNPQRVQINGREYLLLVGRVFVLHDDGTVEQFPLFPSLQVARDPEALGDLIAEGQIFSPPVSATLNDLDTPRANAFDLESGRVLDVPGHLLRSAWTDPRQVEWMRENGAHLIAAYWTNHWAVRTVDAMLGSVPENELDGVTARQLRASSMDGGPMSYRTGGDDEAEDTRLESTTSIPSGSRLVFTFRTTSGTLGTIQLEEADLKPPSLKVHYRRLLAERSGEGSAREVTYP